MNAIIKWCASDTPVARLSRTIFQGFIGVIIANIDYLVGMVVLDPPMRALIVALTMAILSPIQAAIGDVDED